MKDVFIVNPKSGKNSQYELIQEIKEHFQGKRIIIEKTKGPEHATFIAKKYALSNAAKKTMSKRYRGATCLCAFARRFICRRTAQKS